MPDRHLYERVALSSAEFIRTFAEAHHGPEVRHISDYEYEMLQQAADELQSKDSRIIPPPPPPDSSTSESREWRLLWEPERDRRTPRPS